MNKWTNHIGFSVLFGSYLVLVYIFMNAYFSITKKIIVNINSLDFIIFAVTLPMVIYCFINHFKSLR